MYREIMISRVDGSEEPTPLLANAATPRRYKQIFGADLLTLFANAAHVDETGEKHYQIDFIAELAFVMAMQARALDDKKPLKIEKLNENALIDWLEQFDGMAIENAASDIMDVYLGNIHSDSESKKNNDEQNES